MDQQIIDNNILIAEFMEYRHNDKPMAFMAINYEKLYHKDWNWLMPVVKKITGLSDQETYFEVGHIYDEISNSLFNASISATYKAVVEFIKWNNKEAKQ
jgi:hypothetical protein